MAKKASAKKTAGRTKPAKPKVIFFFSNRSGSIVISVDLSAVSFLVMRGCSLGTRY